MALTPFKKICIFIGMVQAILTMGLISLEILKAATNVLSAGTRRFMPQAPVVYGVLTFANLVLAVGLFQRQLNIDDIKKRKELEELEKKELPFSELLGKEGAELDKEIAVFRYEYYYDDLEMNESKSLLTKGN